MKTDIDGHNDDFVEEETASHEKKRECRAIRASLSLTQEPKGREGNGIRLLIVGSMAQTPTEGTLQFKH